MERLRPCKQIRVKKTKRDEEAKVQQYSKRDVNATIGVIVGIGRKKCIALTVIPKSCTLQANEMTFVCVKSQPRHPTDKTASPVLDDQAISVVESEDFQHTEAAAVHSTSTETRGTPRRFMKDAYESVEIPLPREYVKVLSCNDYMICGFDIVGQSGDCFCIKDHPNKGACCNVEVLTDLNNLANGTLVRVHGSAGTVNGIILSREQDTFLIQSQDSETDISISEVNGDCGALVTSCIPEDRQSTVTTTQQVWKLYGLITGTFCESEKPLCAKAVSLSYLLKLLPAMWGLPSYRADVLSGNINHFSC